MYGCVCTDVELLLGVCTVVVVLLCMYACVYRYVYVYVYVYVNYCVCTCYVVYTVVFYNREYTGMCTAAFVRLCAYFLYLRLCVYGCVCAAAV